MRALFDFIAGLFGGLRNRTLSSYTGGRGVNARRKRRRSPRPPWQTALWIIAAVLLVWCVAAFIKKPVLRYWHSLPEAARALDEVVATDPNVSMRNWTSIVIHHSGTKSGSARSFDEYHRFQRGWTHGLGYHFVIGNGNDQGDGVIVAGPRWKQQQAGAHANSTEYNEHGIGICLVGNFDEAPPTPAQLSAVRALIARLAHDFGIHSDNVYGHGQIRRGGGTACPGKLLNIYQLREAAQ